MESISFSHPASPHCRHRCTLRGATRLQSLFGLGPAEVAIIFAAGLLVIGPTNLARFSRTAGTAAGKTVSSSSSDGGGWIEGLRAVPDEFKKGVEEGEIEARGRKARVMDDVGED